MVWHYLNCVLTTFCLSPAADTCKLTLAKSENLSYANYSFPPAQSPSVTGKGWLLFPSAALWTAFWGADSVLALFSRIACNEWVKWTFQNVTDVRLWLAFHDTGTEEILLAYGHISHFSNSNKRILFIGWWMDIHGKTASSIFYWCIQKSADDTMNPVPFSRIRSEK